MKRILQFFSVILLSCLAVVLFGIYTHPNAEASDCEWQDAGHISCGGQTGGTTNYYFNSGITQGNGDGRYAVFIGGSPKNKQLYIDLQGDGTFTYFWSVPKGSDENAENDDSEKKKDLGNHANTSKDAPGSNCSLKKYTDCTPAFASDSDRGDWENDFGKPSTTDRWGNVPPFTQENIDKFNKTEAKNRTDEDSGCEKAINNPLSFFLCPLSRAITETVDKLTGFLVNTLTIRPLTSQGTGPDGVNSVQAGFNNFRSIANSLYIIIFLVIIFSNFFSTGLDNYSIKKVLPRLIAAVIATQFGFLICSLMIDFSNVLLVLLPAAVGSKQTLGEAISSNLVTLSAQGSAQGFLSGIAFFIIILFLAIAILVIVILALGYIVFRNVFLIVLVFISPLAFAAWVLPQTQQYAKKWATWFIKLILMGPIIALILAVTVVIKTIFDASDDPFLNFIGVFVPFIGIAIIPKSLKWSGDVMNTAGKAISQSAIGKAASGAAKKAGKESLASGQVGKGLGKAVGGTFGKIPGFKTAGTKYAAKKSGAYTKAQKENYGDFSVKDLSKLATARGATGENARRALASKRQELSYEMSRNASHGIAPSAGQLESLKEMNTALGNPSLGTDASAPVTPYIPPTLLPSSDSKGNAVDPATHWADVVTTTQTNGSSGGGNNNPAPASGAPPTPQPPPGAPAGGGNATPATAATPGQRAANAAAGARAGRQAAQQQATNRAASTEEYTARTTGVDTTATGQQIDDAAQRAREILDNLNNPTPPTTP